MDLLPDNIAERCQGRVAIIVTKLPGLEVEGYDTFRSKADLVDAVMASGEPRPIDGVGPPWAACGGM